MKDIQYQQRAISELIDKTIHLLDIGGERRKIVFEAPTGAGKTVMACATLAGIVDELKNRGDSRYTECAFIWFAPRKLHIQSYRSLKGAFGETRKLTPVMFDELDQEEGIQPGEILFINWESIIRDNSRIVRDSESGVSLYEVVRRTRDQGLPIVAVIDEEHLFWSKTADKTAQVLDNIRPEVELRISATPKTTRFDEMVKVHRRDVIQAEMIKKEVVLNPDIDIDASTGFGAISMEERLLKVALAKREQLAADYRSLGIDYIKPLLLVQLPNDTRETMTTEDTAVYETVTQYLACQDITVANGRLAVWLSSEKHNLEGLERGDNGVQVLLFKEAIALGWDCPRAAVLLIFRKLQSDTFTVQTVGRILRMPEQKHYPKDSLNIGYVYTDISKDKIQIIAADQDYLLKNTLVARRRPDLQNVVLPSVYADHPNAEHNYLGPDFRRVLESEVVKNFKLQQNGGLFSLADLAAMDGDEPPTPLPDSGNAVIEENRRIVSKTLRIDVRNVNVAVPKNVHFQNEIQTLNAEQAKFARTAGEIDRAFRAYIDKKGGQFEYRQGGRTDRIATYLLGILEDYLGLFETDAKKVVLYHENQPKIDRIIDLALDEYMRIRHLKRGRAVRPLKQYEWSVPEERVYDGETNHAVPDIANHALDPYVRLNDGGSRQEDDFVAFLEANTAYIDWWYKNGDKGRQNYAVEYDRDGTKALFYVDFVIRMRNGRVYLFDTKTEESDPYAPQKHNALHAYMQAENAKGADLRGGIIIKPQGRDYWLYSPLPIDNTTDLTGWDIFDPRNA